MQGKLCYSNVNIQQHPSRSSHVPWLSTTCKSSYKDGSTSSSAPLCLLPGLVPLNFPRSSILHIFFSLIYYTTELREPSFLDYFNCAEVGNSDFFDLSIYRWVYSFIFSRIIDRSMIGGLRRTRRSSSAVSWTSCTKS